MSGVSSGSRERVRQLAFNCQTLEYLGTILDIQTVTAGLAHSVTRIIGSRGTAYLKQNSENLHLRAGQHPTASSIQRETQALTILHDKFPHIFPKVLESDPTRELLITTSVMTPDRGLEHLLLNGKLSPRDAAASVGAHIAQIHRATKSIPPLDPEIDHLVRIRHLNDRFGIFESDDTDRLVQRLSQSQDQFLMADLAPKNLGFENTRQLKVCDLEMAHHGNSMFDLGYAAGHLALHAVPQGDRAVVDTLLDATNAYGYASGKSMDVELLQKVVAGIILYRTAHPVWQYDAGLSEQQIANAARGSRTLLSKTKQLGWKEFVHEFVEPTELYAISKLEPLPFELGNTRQLIQTS